MDELTRLALEARSGNRWSLHQLIRSTQGQVWRFCAHAMGASSADDLTQETYVRAWLALPGFRGEAAATTWLLAIARRTCAEHWRREHRRDLALRLMPRGPAVGSDLGESCALEALVSSLEIERRTAFVLTQLLGCSYAETAEVCGCPIGTVRSRVARARADLLAIIGDRGRADGRA